MALDDVLRFLTARLGQRVALVGHARPDGDALGSVVGLALSLAALGCHARAVNPLPLPSYLEFIAPPSAVARHDDPEWWRDYDCLGVLDCGEASRLDAINQSAIGRLPTFTIDHHATSAGLGEAVWIEPAASATGEMVARLIREAGWPIPPAAAQALWTAIVTDTGRFSHENTTPAALAAARDCVMAGAEPAVAASHLYQSVGVPERRLQQMVLERMELLEGGRLALAWLRHEDFAAAGSGVEGAQNLINLLRDTAGVEVAIFLYEPPGDNTGQPPVKVSLRTRAPHNALDIACAFSGGGHQRAAGCSVPGPMDEARRTIAAEALRRYFGS